jgi:tenascin
MLAGQSARRLLSADPCGCNGHGECVTDAATLSSICSCHTGWSGVNCTVVLNCAANNWCNGKGICIKGGVCACDPGWTGSNCSVGLCPQNCSSHGVCNPTTRECACDPGWEGRACSIQGCASNCTQHGVCVDGQCECDPGWTGVDCQNFICLNQCSGNGICNQALGRCECSPWFTGEDCSTQLCPLNCTGRGSCVNGQCVCDSGWSGSDCSNHICPKACSGRGNCQPDGVCACQTGYTGPACDLLSSCSVYDCSGHGTCRLSPGQNASCYCDPGWAGIGCEQFVAVSIGGLFPRLFHARVFLSVVLYLAKFLLIQCDNHFVCVTFFVFFMILCASLSLFYDDFICVTSSVL